MNLRKNVVLIVGGAVCLVFVVAASVILWRSFSDYRRAKIELDDTTRRLDGLYRRDPFPSDPNIRVVQNNLEVVQDAFAALLSRLRTQQLESKTMEAAEFPRLLGEVINGLYQRSAEGQVRMPERFAFGYDAYVKGQLPVASDIPRLTVELQTTARLCDLLFQAKITELVSIQRAAFESGEGGESTPGGNSGLEMMPGLPAGGPPMGGPPGMMGGPLGRARAPAAGAQEAAKSRAAPSDPDGLFSWEPYELVFKCTDSALWNVLNTLATNPMFAIVTSLRLEAESVNFSRGIASERTAGAGAAGLPALLGPVMRPPMAGGADALAPGAGAATRPAEAVRPSSREDRTVAGRELISVRLAVNVYRFPVRERAGEAKP